MQRAQALLLLLSLVGIATIASAAAPGGARPYLQDVTPEAQGDQPSSQPDQAQAPDQGQPSDQGSVYQPFSAEQLDNLLSPIALYPDPLLAQTLVAASFPDQIEEAARYVRANGQGGIDDQDWDVSVKAIAHYPAVLQMMADKIDWTTSVGQAYVNQSADVSASIQRLRHMARQAGNLETTPQEEVLVNGDYIAIDPLQPQFIYVPLYDPAICFYRRPFWGPAITFSVGFPIGAWLNLDFHWGFGGGWGGVFYTGWQPWGGWNAGWMVRSRVFVHVNNVYVNNRFRNIVVSRAVINRTVNVANINRFNYVHKNVTFNNVVRQNNFQAASERLNNRMQNNNPPQVNNRILNRNIDVANARINEFRGREVQNANRPPAQVESHPGPEAGVRAFGRPEGSFNARVSSQRGQDSRQQMNRAVSVPRGGGGHPSGGGGGGGKRR